MRRNQRLPRVLVVDNGKEFHSHELEYFCRIYGVELRYRSPGMPRGAAMVERAFGAIEEEVFSEMAGNTRIMKQNTRQVTKEVDPYRQTEWTLASVYGATEDYLFNVRANRAHPSLGVTPNEYEMQSAAKAGQRDCRMFTLDEKPASRKRSADDLSKAERNFLEAVSRVQQQWPCARVPNLVAIWEQLMQLSLGSVGLLKSQLLQLASLQMSRKGEALLETDLQRAFKPPKQLRKIENETVQGEEELEGACYGEADFGDATAVAQLFARLTKKEVANA